MQQSQFHRQNLAYTKQQSNPCPTNNAKANQQGAQCLNCTTLRGQRDPFKSCRGSAQSGSTSTLYVIEWHKTDYDQRSSANMAYFCSFHATQQAAPETSCELLLLNQLSLMSKGSITSVDLLLAPRAHLKHLKSHFACGDSPLMYIATQ